MVVLDYAAMTEDFLTPEQEEVDIVLARATSRHVRDLFVAGRRVVGDGVLFGLDLPDAEREFMERARRVAALDAEQRRPVTGDVAKVFEPTMSRTFVEALLIAVVAMGCVRRGTP